MKYVNPEYVSILAMSEDVITVSVVTLVKEDLEKGINYTQTKNTDYTKVDENGVPEVTTTISANLSTLLGI